MSSPKGTRRAVVLLSGGMDSTVCVPWARKAGYEVWALTVRYGLPPIQERMELAAARRVAAAMGITHHRIVHVDFPGLDWSTQLPEPMASWTVPPVIHVPFRTGVFLAAAAAWAEVIQASAVVIGCAHGDVGYHADSSPEFLEAMQAALRRGLHLADGAASEFRIEAPLLTASKVEVVRLAHELGADLSLTRTCWHPVAGGLSCGKCVHCLSRLAAFAEAGLTDPISYAPQDPAEG